MRSAERWRIEIGGAVQGVGFRPFVYRTAFELGISGWVLNSATGVICEAEAIVPMLDQFVDALRRNSLPLAHIDSITYSAVKPDGSQTFEIRDSPNTRGPVDALVLPDIATCPDCFEDIFDPNNRRHLYPFTNCTNCGPRYSIIDRLPYDRRHTSMANFTMCPACQQEYEDPLDRRFHAQPNCCPDCGPQLALWDAQGQTIATRHNALQGAADAIRDGKIAAIKGLGGFLLLVDACNEDAVQLLRERKQRPDKPLAVMLPDRATTETHCYVSEQEAALLASPQSPIVLLARRQRIPIEPVCERVAPDSPDLGVMLPYTPLHHTLMRNLAFPVVASSGNLTNEPLAYENEEALRRLNGIADVFLVHDRPILAPVDDSVVRVIGDAPMILRRARGYSPYPLPVHGPALSNSPIILGVGGHLSNTVTLLKGNRAHVGPHVGNLESPEAIDAFEHTIGRLCTLNQATPDAVACDLHNDYQSSNYAQNTELPILPVQHHVAHIAACMAEHNLQGTALGVAWDGAGLGDDGTMWGGEFLQVKPGNYHRVAHLRQFRLPGGEAATREPRRSAIGLLWALDGSLSPSRAALTPITESTAEERQVLCRMLDSGLNAPITSSAGRLFDAVAALIGLRQRSNYQGQAAAELEWAINTSETDQRYSFETPTNNAPTAEKPRVLDWGPMMHELISDIAARTPQSLISAKFHNTLVELIVSVIEWQQIDNVVFGGGCFQNKYLTGRLMQRLLAMGVKPFFPQTIPPNDGGLSLGQIYWARHILSGE